MNYPLLSDYIEAIKASEDNFEQLKNLRPVLGADGEPVFSSGNFAVVFKMKDEQTGKLHAVKCFLREQEGRAEAYRQIAEELEYVSSTFLTPIKYIDKELFVDTNVSDDTEFPVLLMDWVEGDTLDKYIRKHLDDQYELSLLAYQFSRLAMWLMPQPFAHGDLKPDNILVKSDGTLVLVDYDGMYVPTMKGQRARELGSPDFRHPSRTEIDFDEHIDDFSLASILLSLKAISLQPSLLEEYGASNRLLFSEKDYRNLSDSEVLNALRPLMQDVELASLYSLFILVISQNNLSQVSFRLFNLSRPEKPQYDEKNLSTEVTEEDLANAWTDEYGVMYSSDRKRLLKASRNLKDYYIRKGTIVICNEAFHYEEAYNISLGKGYKTVTMSSVYKCKDLESVTIPDSVIIIGSSAFSGCNSLQSINIPNNVAQIGDFAFWGCSKIESVTIPCSVSVIGQNPFAGCVNLTSIKVDKENRYYDSRENCNAIIETRFNKLLVGCCISQIPPDISEIGNCAFLSCKTLKTLFIPPTISKIGENSFEGCSGLTNIEFSKGILTIGQSAFQGCLGLSSIDLPDGLTTIGSEAFKGCTGLTKAVIPNSLAILYANGTTEKYEYDYLTPESWKKYEDISFSDVIEIGGLDIFIGCDNLATICVPFATKAKFEEFFPLHKDKLIEQVDEDEICLAYCSENSQACEDKEYALWQPHSKIIKKNGKMGVVLDDGTTKKQIIPFNYDTWFDYDGYETYIRENFFDNYQDYIGYFAIRNTDSTFTINGFDKDGNITESFICEKFDPDSYLLKGKYYLRHSVDGEGYDDIRRMRMDCETYSDTCYLAFRKGNKWSLKSDDLKFIYIDYIECDGLGKMVWTPKGYYIEIKKEGKAQLCLYKTKSGPLILPNMYDYISLRHYSTNAYKIQSSCFVLRQGDLYAICSNDLHNISPFIFSKVGSMINDNEVKVMRNVKGKEYEFIYKIINSNGWRYKESRPFSADEVAAVKRTEVVASQYGNSLCIFMQSGRQTYIPLSKYSTLTVGDELDLKTAKLFTLSRDGDDDIYRVIE